MQYADSLAFAGKPFLVPSWDAPVLLRQIAGTGFEDAMGVYPVCVLGPNADITAGCDELRAAGAVSVVLVADPLVHADPGMLRTQFPVCRPFKTHYVIDRALGDVAPTKHHADRIRRGERHAAARIVDLRDSKWLSAWCTLYAGLVQHRGIRGLQAFSAEAFRRLASLPPESLIAFAAETPSGEVLAMQLWIRHGDCAYSHLTATSPAGYRLGATYVVYAAALRELTAYRFLDLGGGAGVHDDPSDSLAIFKQGFTNTTRMAHLCGAILDETRYDRLSRNPSTTYFPAYRAPTPTVPPDPS